MSGRYVVQGNDLVFTPELPLREARELSPGVFDNGGAGLEPGKQYALRVGPGTWPGFVNSVAPLLRSRYPDPGDARNVLLPFTTTTVLADFFIDRHAVFGVDGTVGFYAWYGFLSCVVLIVAARGLGVFLKRDAGYYDHLPRDG